MSADAVLDRPFRSSFHDDPPSAELEAIFSDVLCALRSIRASALRMVSA